MIEDFHFKEEDNPLWERANTEEVEPEGLGPDLTTSFKMSLLQFLIVEGVIVGKQQHTSLQFLAHDESFLY